MLRNKTQNQTKEGAVVSASAAGTNADGKPCQHQQPQQLHQQSKCAAKTCDYLAEKPKAKYQNPQWLCYEGILEVVNWIRERTEIVPQVAILSGRGLGGLAEMLEDKIVFKYSDLPHFHVIDGSPDAPQQMTLGKLGRKRVAVLQGRLPPYEGFHYGVSSMPVRVLRMLGATHFLNLNSVSSLNPDIKVGDFVVVQDHLNLPGICGLNPLKGPNDERLGARFPELTPVYDRELRQLFRDALEELDEKPRPRVREGVASLVSGPAYLTPAESHAMKTLGVDVVGMSGAHENVVAKHGGMKVLGVSLVARLCSLKEDQPPANEEKNKEIVMAKAELLTRILDNFIKNLDLI